MLSYYALVIICLISSLSLSQFPVRCEEESKSDELAVDLNTNGFDLKFPFFGEQLKSLDPTRKKLIEQDIEELFTEIDYVVDNILGRSFSIGLPFEWAKAGTNLALMFLRQSRRRSGVKVPDVPMKNEYNHCMSDMFKRALGKVDDYERKMKDENKKKDTRILKNVIKNLIGAMRQAIDQSPVVNYIGWQKGTVNGAPFEEFLAEIMARMRYNGMGGSLSVVQKFVY